MIKFFRKIRQNMINENKASKYMLYAIGEIVLVVIGILIALWLNQRASFNAEREGEIRVLKEIRRNLDGDLKEINLDITYMDSLNLACDEIINYIKINDKPNARFERNAAVMRVTTHFNPNKSGYNLLVSKGIEIIENNELREAISVHFESLYTYYNLYEKERIQFRLLHIEPVLINYFGWKKRPNSPYLGIYSVSQSDYTKLKSDDIFYKTIIASQRENYSLQDRAYRVHKSIIELSKLLDEELAEREK